jgi:hypothetical protein
VLDSLALGIVQTFQKRLSPIHPSSIQGHALEPLWRERGGYLLDRLLRCYGVQTSGVQSSLHGEGGPSPHTSTRATKTLMETKGMPNWQPVGQVSR